MDIIIVNNEIVRFKKILWHHSEILLAQCFNFKIDSELGVIEAEIKVTSKRSLFEFIKLSFKNFSESPLEEQRRTKFYEDLSNCYNSLNEMVEEEIKKKLPYHDKLYAHQKDTLKESYFKRFNFYALDMGLGKTLTSASMSRLHQCSRTVITCPAAVKWNWYRDLVHFGFNELYFTIMDSRKSRNIKALIERFVIVNYDILGNFTKELLSSPIDHFILDEAHALKNHNSQRYKNLIKIIHANPQARITFLSGTPVKNRVNDVFAYLKLIGHQLGMSHQKFINEYTVSTTGSRGTQIKGGRNLQDLYVKLSNFMIRKTKEQCLDLPEKVFLNYKYEMEDYRMEYDKVIEELSQQKEISSLTGNLHSLNIITSKAKLKGIIEIAESIMEQDRKVVIFGSYTAPLEELEKYFGEACVKITGRVDSFTRDQHVQKFHKDPECKVFLGNMIAAGVGINLTNASDVIFINFPFTPAELYQAMDRLHRIGQKSSVNVHYTFCEDSIDEEIYALIMDKEKDINTLIDKGKEVVLKDNMVQILISKLLKKNVDIEIPVSEMDGEAQDEKVEKSIHNGMRSNNESNIKSNDVGPGNNDNNRASEEIIDKWIMSEQNKKPGHTLIGTDKENIVQGQKYYVLHNSEEDHLFVSNESDLRKNLINGCHIQFEHEDPQQCIIHGTHFQIKHSISFDRNYRPNSIDKNTIYIHGTGSKNSTIDLPDFD